MSGSPRRRRVRREEDISGQFRVTVPDAEELDQLRTRGGVYRRGLYTAGNRGNAPPEETQSLPASSRESSTEPMDTDDARQASEEIYRRIRQQAGLSRSGSVGDITLQPAPLGIMTQRVLQLRGTDFYLPLGGQPRISERKSWRAPIVTEQGNPGIYVQIDEWLPLYKGNIYVVDEVTGRMYLAKGEHLMWIAETASHRPFQDHELSMSRHIPEREYPGQGGQELPLGPRPKIAREGRGDLNPLTSTVGEVGEIGRTPIPVAESTRHPGEKLLPSVREHEREDSNQTGESTTPAQGRGGAVGEVQGDHEGREFEWALPRPSDLRRPPKGRDRGRGGNLSGDPGAGRGSH